MTIKDINPIDFANMLRKRLDSAKLSAAQDSGQALLATAKKGEIAAIAHWAATQVFGEDEDQRKAFLRMAGVIQ
jgi:hypothetical protein